jgi:hypothetical protein
VSSIPSRSLRIPVATLLTGAVLTLSVWTALPAWAGVGLAADPIFPSIVTVGDTDVSASVIVVNQSNAGEAVGNVAVTSLRLVPSCSRATASDPECDIAPSIADPGTFTLSATGAGQAGTACGGQTFSITTSNPATGEVSFAPTVGTLVLGPPSIGNDLDMCRIHFMFSVNDVPDFDQNSAVPGLQTAQLASAVGQHQTSGVAGAGFGSDTTTVTAPPPPQPDLTLTANPVNRPAPGGDFTYTVALTNSGPAPFVITLLNDDIYGDLAALPGTNTCDDLIGDALAAGATVNCSYVGEFTGFPGASQTNVVTVVATDSLGMTGTDSDDANVTLTSPPLPSVSLDKTASPPIRPVPGGNFTFTLVVSNTGAVSVTITSLTDDIYGNLATRPAPNTCDDLIGDFLPPGGSATCAFDGAFTSPTPATQTDVATVVVTDDFGRTATDSDDVVVTLAGSRMADFDANGTTDIAVWRESTGQWFVMNQFTQNHGLPNDVPVAGDYDGSGDADVAVWRRSTGQWWIVGQPVVNFGLNGDYPVPADYDGNGITDIAVWRTSTGQWFIQNQPAAINWGLPGDVPVPADYDGNGTDDIAVWRPSTGQWFVLNQSLTNWGIPNDIPVPGDYDGDGTDEIAVWRPSTGQWFGLGGSTIPWGVPGDMPVQGDYDGNGTTDRVVYRDGEWLFQATGISVYWGLAGDIPAPLPPPIYLAFFD